jgi:hypothetical protein
MQGRLKLLYRQWLRDLFTFSSKVNKKVYNSIKERLNVKKARNLRKKGNKGKV